MKLSDHPLFGTYHGMLTRCYNPKAEGYDNYGGRGIFVIDRWRGRVIGFTNFVADMGPKPSPEHTLDRKDNDGPYSPDNCRWATNSEQTRNSRHAHLIEVGGVRKHLRDWAHEKGIQESTLDKRLLRSGWSEERAVNAPIDVHIPRGYTRNDLTGNRYGFLLVLEFAGSTGSGHSGRKALWRVRCDCGVEKVMRGAWLTRKTKPVFSCGCGGRNVKL